jgi:hypothetical protein
MLHEVRGNSRLVLSGGPCAMVRGSRRRTTVRAAAGPLHRGRRAARGWGQVLVVVSCVV